MTRSQLDELSSSIPLSWLLRQRQLDLRALHLPDPGVAVSVAHAIEVDDAASWLRGGELVMTTGLRLPPRAASRRDYVAGLAAGGAAALGFGVGMRFETVPPELVSASQETGLALVEVPLPTPFVAIARTVADRLAELRSRRLADVLDGQRALTRSASRGGAGAVARTLARLLDAGVLIADTERSAVARHGAAPSAEALRAETGSSARAVSLHQAGQIEEFVPFGPRAAAPAGWLGLRRGAVFAATDRLLINHAASLLGLQWARPGGHSRDAEHGVILRGLLDGTTPAEVGAALGLPAGAVRVIAHDDQQLGTRLGQRGLPGLHAPVDLVRPTPGIGWVAVVGAGEAEPVSAGLEGRAGVSAPVALADLADGWADAVRAFDAASPGQAVWAEAMTGTGMTSPAGARAVVDATAEWLDRLAAYDAETGTDLIDTLAVFVAQLGNADHTARLLGCHRHTVRNRLAKIAEISGADLDDPRTRALLTLALADH